MVGSMHFVYNIKLALIVICVELWYSPICTIKKDQKYEICGIHRNDLINTKFWWNVAETWWKFRVLWIL